MVTTYFNWDELLVLGRKDLAAILCLAYAQTNVYNELSSKTMLRTLNIHHIPRHIFNKNCFYLDKRVGLVCYYKTKEPQSYFRNPEFLFYNVPARKKVVYLKALSMRRINENQNYIPKKYFENVTENPFLTITDDRIYFPLESL